MNLGIVTIAYNGYGKFLPRWCESIAALDKQPQVVTIVLGQQHEFAERDRCMNLLSQLQVVEYDHRPTMGRLRNVAVNHTETEWIQYLSADDVILPWAVDEYEKYEDVADFIVIRWKSRTMWDRKAPEYEHTPRTPYEMAKGFEGRGFINNQSPYRRWLWEGRPYHSHDYPNAPFIADCVEQHARFVRTERPCTVYLRRLDSHCGKNLGRRKKPGMPARINAEEKRQANFWKYETQSRICAYYGES